MSYILEALKKAERDRHAGEAPALDDALRPQASAARRAAPDNRLRAVAIAVATVVVLGLGGWLLLGSPANRAGDPVAVVEADAADSAPEPALRVDPERLADPVADAPAEAFAEAPAEPLQAFAEEPASDAAVETASTLDELVDDPVPPRATPPPPATSAAPVPAPPAAIDAFATPLKDLPASFRAEFPRLGVDVHFYDDNPLRRFVLINGRKYRETDTLVEGPRLIEIVPMGLVFDHRGTRVLQEIPR